MAAVLFLGLLAGGCGDNPPPTTPAPVPTPSPTPTPPMTVRYSVSGVVTDDAGAAVGGAHVQVRYNFSVNASGFPGITTLTTDAMGRYELQFDAIRPFPNVPSAVADILAWASGFDYVQQMLPWGTTTISRSLVLGQPRTITAGESLTLAVSANSSICSDTEDWFIPARQCGQIHVTAPANGNLVIDARPLQDLTAVPIVFSATTGFYQRQVLGPGTVTLLEVRAGQSYHIFIGSPEGVVSQHYAVTTSLQTPGS